jgi:signal transduction histidine kinase
MGAMLGRSDQDAKDWVAKAIAFYKTYGKAIALYEFSKRKGPFIEDEMYIFVLSQRGTILAHGVDEKYIGNDFMDIIEYEDNFIDVEGYEGRRFIMEIVEAANTQGSGFVEYTWHDPVKKEIVPKRLYFEKVDDIIICSGVYKKTWEEQY